MDWINERKVTYQQTNYLDVRVFYQKWKDQQLLMKLDGFVITSHTETPRLVQNIATLYEVFMVRIPGLAPVHF